MKLISKINSMGRKGQLILYIMIILLFIAWRFNSGYSYASPEAVFYACERGLHYGPSEKILHIERQGINALVIGKCGDGLSSVPTYKTRLGTWQLGHDREGTGVEGYTEVNGITSVYNRDFKAVYGLSNVEGIKSVNIVLGEYKSGGYVILAEILMDVDSNGFFFDSTVTANVEFDPNDWPYVLATYGYDENGETIYSENIVGQQIFDSDGNLIYSDFDEPRGVETIE